MRQITKAPPVRRIVTGHAWDGRSIVVSDGRSPVTIDDFGGNPGLYFSEIWRTSGALPEIGNTPEPTTGDMTLATDNAGTTFRLVDFPASRRDPANPATTDPGDFLSPMHRTHSIDYGIVLSGEIRLVLSDTEHVLRVGDIVIQRGTDHAWANRAQTSARVAFILIAGNFMPDIEPFVEALSQ